MAAMKNIITTHWDAFIVLLAKKILLLFYPDFCIHNYLQDSDGTKEADLISMHYSSMNPKICVFRPKNDIPPGTVAQKTVHMFACFCRITLLWVTNSESDHDSSVSIIA